MSNRRVHAPEFKAKVALEALSGNKTLAEVAAIYRLHPVQVCQWKQQVTKRLPDLYRNSDSLGSRESAEKLILKIDKLEQVNAALIQELEWTKKNFTATISKYCAHAWSQAIALYRCGVNVSCSEPQDQATIISQHQPVPRPGRWRIKSTTYADWIPP